VSPGLVVGNRFDGMFCWLNAVALGGGFGRYSVPLREPQCNICLGWVGGGLKVIFLLVGGGLNWYVFLGGVGCRFKG